MKINSASYFLNFNKLMQFSSKCKIIKNILQKMIKFYDFIDCFKKLIIISNSSVIVCMMIKISVSIININSNLYINKIFLTCDNEIRMTDDRKKSMYKMNLMFETE